MFSSLSSAVVSLSAQYLDADDKTSLALTCKKNAASVQQAWESTKFRAQVGDKLIHNLHPSLTYGWDPRLQWGENAVQVIRITEGGFVCGWLKWTFEDWDSCGSWALYVTTPADNCHEEDWGCTLTYHKNRDGTYRLGTFGTENYKLMKNKTVYVAAVEHIGELGLGDKQYYSKSLLRAAKILERRFL